MNCTLGDIRLRFMVLVLLFLSSSPALAAESLKDIKSELKAMQDKVNSLETSLNRLNTKSLSGRGQFQTFVADSLALGGFFENSITTMWGPDSPSETLADRHKLGINLSAELGHRFRFVSQFTMGFNFPLRNEHNNPSHGSILLPLQRSHGDLSFGSVLSQAFGEYDLGKSLKFQFGMGYVPFGRAFQIREPVLFLRHQGPQLIRTASASEIIVADPFWKGLHLKGSLSDNSGFNLYTLSSLDHSGKLGGGARVWTKLGSKIMLGVSAQSAERSQENYIAYGGDLNLSHKNFGVQVEYAVNDSALGEVSSYYVQPYLKLLNRKLTLHLDVDYMKNILGLTTLGNASVADPYRKWEYGFGFNYQFLPNVKVRMGFLMHDYSGSTAVVAGQDRDYFTVSNSWGISF